MSLKLLGDNTKTEKAEKLGYENKILHLAPESATGRIFQSYADRVTELAEKRLKRKLTREEKLRIALINTCNNAGACKAYCLNTAGRGKFGPTQHSRAAKTIFSFFDPKAFEAKIQKEIQNLRKNFEDEKLAIRLNGTSDLDFSETIGLFPTVKFYDYTKSISRICDYIQGILPENYHLTFSYDVGNDKKNPYYLNNLETFLRYGVNVAIIRKDYERLAKRPEFKNIPTIDGDEHDLRFLDPKGCFVVLELKKTVKFN